MNTLGYAILSVLGERPCSGYELASYLEVLWPAKHSQIYPLLSKMEQKGFLIFEQIEQTGKPNKKVYSITDQGVKALKSWINDPPADRNVRDEFLIKVYSIWLQDKESAKKLIEDRKTKLMQRMTIQETDMKEVEKNQVRTSSKHLGRYLLAVRRNLLDQEEISWCNWVLQFFENISFIKVIIGVLSVNMLSEINVSLTMMYKLIEF